jgi:hypothetical protein
MTNPEENQLLNMETLVFCLHVWNLTQFHVAIQPQSAIKSLLVGLGLMRFGLVWKWVY